MVKTLWQCNYVLGCGRAIAGKPTGCVSVQLPWSRAGLAESCMIQIECHLLAWVGLVFFSFFLLTELILVTFAHIKTVTTVGCYQWLLKKGKFLCRRLQMGM